MRMGACCKCCNTLATIRAVVSGVDATACSGCNAVTIINGGGLTATISVNSIVIAVDGTHDLAYQGSSIDAGNLICVYRKNITSAISLTQYNGSAVCGGSPTANSGNLALAIRYNKTLGIIDTVNIAGAFSSGSFGFNYFPSPFNWYGSASPGATFTNQQVCGTAGVGGAGVATGGQVVAGFL